MSHAFKVGDRVTVTGHYDGLTRLNAHGTVIEAAVGRVGVEFDQRHPVAHSCGGRCDDGRGWYYSGVGLKLLNLLPTTDPAPLPTTDPAPLLKPVSRTVTLSYEDLTKLLQLSGEKIAGIFPSSSGLGHRTDALEIRLEPQE